MFFCYSLHKVLELADDIVIDVPNLWDYLAEFLSPIVLQCRLSLSFLSSVPSSLVCIRYCSWDLIATIYTCCSWAPVKLDCWQSRSWCSVVSTWPVMTMLPPCCGLGHPWSGQPWEYLHKICLSYFLDMWVCY